MLPLLAQTLPPAADLVAFMGCVVFFLLVAVAIKKIFEKRVVQPQPFVVQAHEKFAEASALQAVKQDLENLASQVRDGFQQLNTERRSSVANLHVKVDLVATATSGLEGQLKLLNQQVQQLVIHQLSQTKK